MKDLKNADYNFKNDEHKECYDQYIAKISKIKQQFLQEKLQLKKLETDIE